VWCQEIKVERPFLTIVLPGSCEVGRLETGRVIESKQNLDDRRSRACRGFDQQIKVVGLPFSTVLMNRESAHDDGANTFGREGADEITVESERVQGIWHA
jgi:hypothetical protein